MIEGRPHRAFNPGHVPEPALSQIVIASGNPHKVGELRAILARVGVESVGLDHLPGPPPEPEETGDTFEANAAIKALAYAAATGRVCLADDSGLAVDALDGAPGVLSARYSGDDGARDARDRANNDKLLRELDGVPTERRTARFVCCMALARDGEILATARGTFEGRIGLPGDVPRGRHGFGYDPLFLVAPGFARTSAELDPDEKNRLSHRATAGEAMAVTLGELIRTGWFS